MERLYNGECDYRGMSPLNLAFVGDGVYDLFVREWLACSGNCPVGKLHRLKVEKVCCKAQAEFMEAVMPKLTEEELAVFKRGRNAHTYHTPKNATNEAYHTATGLEALIGYIYLKGDIPRVREILRLIEKV